MIRARARRAAEAPAARAPRLQLRRDGRAAEAPADRAPRLAARRELHAAEVPAAAAPRAAPRSELERSRSPCRRRLLTVPLDSLPVVRPTVSSAPPSRPPPVRSASMRAVMLTRAPRTLSRTPSERRDSLSGAPARNALLWCARGMRRFSWWPPGCLISTVRRPLTGCQVGYRAARARAMPCRAPPPVIFKRLHVCF